MHILSTSNLQYQKGVTHGEQLGTSISVNRGCFTLKVMRFIIIKKNGYSFYLLKIY